MKVLITGADGFIGRNLRCVSGEREGCEVLPVHPREHRRRVAAAGRSGGLGVPPGRRQPPAGPGGVHHRQCRSHRAPVRRCMRAAKPRRSRSSSHRPSRPTRQSLRREQARGRGALPAHAAETGSAGAYLTGCPTCSASGAARTTTRPWPLSATTSRAACRSRSMTRRRSSAGLCRRCGGRVHFVLLGGSRVRVAASRRSTPVYTITVGELARQIQAFKERRSRW